jgi:hypothetical protein
MSEKQYIPAKEPEFFAWSENISSVSTANKTVRGLPEDKPAEMRTLHIEAKALYETRKTASYATIDREMQREKAERVSSALKRRSSGTTRGTPAL